MRKRAFVLCALLACTDTRPVPIAATVDARPDAAPVVTTEPASSQQPSATQPAPSAQQPSGPCAEAIIDATRRKNMGWKLDPRSFDANGDGIDECVLRACYGANCDVVIYVRERAGVRFVGEMTVSFVSSPRCVDQPPKGTFCRIEVGVHMIHGETQETFWKYAGDRYVEDGHGRLIPGPSMHHP